CSPPSARSVVTQAPTPATTTARATPTPPPPRRGPTQPTPTTPRPITSSELTARPTPTRRLCRHQSRSRRRTPRRPAPPRAANRGRGTTMRALDPLPNLVDLPRLPIGDWIEAGVDWLQSTFSVVFDAINGGLQWSVQTLSELLYFPPPLVVVALLA